MSRFLPPNHAVTIRPATQEDFPAIARLLIQLYTAELPGALRGPIQEQQELLHFTLAAKQDQGLQGRTVACDRAGNVVATATVEYPGSTPYDRAPDGTISQAVKRIGYGATARLLMVVARSMVPVPRPHTPDAVWVHSIVVDKAARGQGIGQAMMSNLEQQAHAAGYQTAWLQVLAMNQPARRLYRQLGYTDVWTTPRWQQLLTWPSYLMRKVLASPSRRKDADANQRGLPRIKISVPSRKSASPYSISQDVYPTNDDENRQVAGHFAPTHWQ